MIPSSYPPISLATLYVDTIHPFLAMSTDVIEACSCCVFDGKRVIKSSLCEWVLRASRSPHLHAFFIEESIIFLAGGYTEKLVRTLFLVIAGTSKLKLSRNQGLRDTRGTNRLVFLKLSCNSSSLLPKLGLWTQQLQASWTSVDITTNRCIVST